MKNKTRELTRHQHKLAAEKLYRVFRRYSSYMGDQYHAPRRPGSQFRYVYLTQEQKFRWQDKNARRDYHFANKLCEHYMSCRCRGCRSRRYEKSFADVKQDYLAQIEVQEFLQELPRTY